MPENNNTNDPLKLIIFKSIIYFFIFEFGSSITINTFIIIFNYDSRFLHLMYETFWTTLIIYIIIIISLYTSKTLFHYFYYLFFVFIAWFYHNTGGFIGLYILNKIYELPAIINLIIYIAFGTGLSLLCIYTDNNPKFDKIKIKCPQLKGNINIIHLTDLHLGGAYGKESVNRYVKMIINLNEKIDFVVITGDLVDGNIKVTKEMLEPFYLIKCPIYYVTGNHEELTWKDEFFDLIENNSNLIHLPNNLITFKNRINLIGIDYKTSMDSIIYNLKNICHGINNNYPNIFIHHVPIFKPDTLPNYNIFLFLCGHIHGGKCFPFTLIKFFFGKWLTIIIEGLYTFQNKYFVYCCSGVGTSGPNSRCFVGANIGFITIEGN